MGIVVLIAFWIGAFVVFTGTAALWIGWWTLIFRFVVGIPAVGVFLGILFGVIFLVPQLLWEGSWIAEKAHNGAMRGNDILWWIALAPWHVGKFLYLWLVS